jgi:hypothetical protein
MRVESDVLFGPRNNEAVAVLRQFRRNLWGSRPLHPHLLGRVDPRRRRGLDGEQDDAGNAQMPSKNERVELEMKIMWYRQLGGPDHGRGVSKAYQESTSKAASVASGR